MIRKRLILFTGCAMTALGGCATTHEAGPRPLDVARLPAVGIVSERFLSYNVEMLELTGGRFWKPYASTNSAKTDLYEDRPPIDLTNPRLRALARALGPAYVRYSGTWANGTFFADSETAPATVPKGYDAVLTRRQWRQAVEFARDSDAQIVTSMPTSPGARDADGNWTPQAAERLFAYTQSIGGTIAASEFANEPNLIGGTKPPANYDAGRYRGDFARFHEWLRKRSPGTLILAPGAFELGKGSTFPSFIKKLPTADVAPTAAHRPDAVSFHFYGALSQRCNGLKDIDPQSDTWLSTIDTAIADTAALRDAISPDAPLWLTETADAACGGNPQAKTFADSFRFVDQLARAARQGVQVVMHNTLAASDYALLDEHDFAPRPNYWAAYLWRRTMGTTVLDGGSIVRGDGLRIYAHCQRGRSGGVTVLAINPDRANARTLHIAGRAEVFSLTQPEGRPGSAALNGVVLELGQASGAKDIFPRMEALLRRGGVTVPASSISFITIPDAANPSCMVKG
ncbi:hypothetical protein [Novosphingobium guangzhouense]|uniref:hypothetical protein n=1 Tax=Novosphingobium guangzhouense TaxID=1850347 RepID=UPI001472806F|nr:hypothetical protein [Novosphingobium guangzhouense]